MSSWDTNLLNNIRDPHNVNSIKAVLNRLEITAVRGHHNVLPPPFEKGVLIEFGKLKIRGGGNLLGRRTEFTYRILNMYRHTVLSILHYENFKVASFWCRFVSSEHISCLVLAFSLLGLNKLLFSGLNFTVWLTLLNIAQYNNTNTWSCIVKHGMLTWIEHFLFA